MDTAKVGPGESSKLAPRNLVSWQALTVFQMLRTIRRYTSSLVVLTAVTVLNLFGRSFLSTESISMLYLVAVVVSANYWGLGPSILASVLSVILVDALFDPPYGLFSPSGVEDLVTLGVLLFIGVIISQLGSRIRTQIDEAKAREKQTSALYSLSRNMALAEDWTKLLDVATGQMAQVFGVQVLALLPSPDGRLQWNSQIDLDDTERQAARWAFDHGVRSGQGSDACAEARLSYWPLRTGRGTFGVLALQGQGVDRVLNDGQQRLPETFVGQIAIALEHAKLSEQAEQARVFEANERFRDALLSSLSHDLLTPVTSVLGSVTTLLDGDSAMDMGLRLELLENAKEDSLRLARLVGGLLDMTRLEAGVLAPRRDWYSVEEVVGAALPYADEKRRNVQLALAPDLPLIPIDFVLIEQVLLNLLDNACKFSPPDSLIELTARLDDDFLLLSIADRGPGIPEGERERIFEKFYRISRNGAATGTGLGLSICKGIVEAHGGRIWAEERGGGGALITFALPVGKPEAAG
jgi:two-component system sensor histidine kinase KdpD